MKAKVLNRLCIAYGLLSVSLFAWCVEKRERALASRQGYFSRHGHKHDLDCMLRGE